MNDKTDSLDVLVEFKDDDERALFIEARLGQEAMDFLNSPLGQLLQGRAKQEKEQAVEALLKVSPYDQKEIQRLQNEVYIPGQFIRWIGESIQHGRYAEQQIDELVNED